MRQVYPLVAVRQDHLRSRTACAWHRYGSLLPDASPGAVVHIAGTRILVIGRGFNELSAVER